MQGRFLKIAFVVLLLVGTPIIGSLIFNVASVAYIMQMMGMVNDSQKEAAERKATDFQCISISSASMLCPRMCRDW